MENDMIALARRHVVEGRKIVKRQSEIVTELEAARSEAAADARHTLDLFVRTLAIFEEHLRELTK